MRLHMRRTTGSTLLKRYEEVMRQEGGEGERKRRGERRREEVGTRRRMSFVFFADSLLFSLFTSCSPSSHSERSRRREMRM